MVLHDELSDDVKTRISHDVGEFQRACENEDRLAIDDATVNLAQAMSLAINAVYPSARSDTAVEEPTAARAIGARPGSPTTS